MYFRLNGRRLNNVRKNMFKLVLTAIVCFLVLVKVKADDKTSNVCPSPDFYAPCRCEKSLDNQYLILNCLSSNLNDSRVSEILDAFTDTSGVKPLLGWI